MAPPKGFPKPPGSGLKKGQQLDRTINARKAIADFVNGNVERLTGWLDEIAEKDPEAAFRAFMSVVEYNIPKLARVEQTGEDGGAVKHELQIIINPVAPRGDD